MMKSLKSFIRMAMVALATLALGACDKGEDEGDGLQELNFEVDVENVTATSAKVKVSHDGKTADSWYGLLTTDTTTRIDKLVEATVAELKKGDIGSQLVFSKNYVKILTPLMPETIYRYVVFGLTEDGKVYGNTASIEFATSKNNGGGNGGGNTEDEVYGSMIVNPAWSIAFTGAGTINGESYNNIVTVNSTDNNPYTIAVVYAREYDVALLPELGSYLIENMYAYLDAMNSAYGESLILNDLLYRGNGMTAFEELEPGYYVAVALGVTSKGELSGLYAVSPAFEIEEEVPTSLYTAWLGDWVINGDNKKSNEVVIARKFANRSVNLIGLMGLPFSIEGEYSMERNDIIFYAQMVYPNYTFNDGTVANIVLLGVDKEGQIYGLDNGEYGIAIAGVLEGGQRAIVRYGVNQPDYPKFVAMFLTAELNGKYYDLGSEIPAFNVMATIDAADTQLAAPMRCVWARKSLPMSERKLSLGKEIEVVNF